MTAKPESSYIKCLQLVWTPPGLDPGSAGVRTFYETIKFGEALGLKDEHDAGIIFTTFIFFHFYVNYTRAE